MPHPSLHVREYRDGDWSEWLRMTAALFPHEATDDLARGMREHRARADAAVFVAARHDGGLAGFVEAGARPYADGCHTSPVGYAGAWFVDADVRRAGVGRALLDAAEAWARAAGYPEMASNALLDNVLSHQAHARSGYVEVGRVVQFRKPLTPDARDDANRR
jgi:aminoglycoside 6'-N-acetyltransferase I